MFRNVKIVDPYNTMGSALQPRRDTPRRLTREARARYEKAVAEAVQAYVDGNQAKYQSASDRAGDILDDFRNWAGGQR